MFYSQFILAKKGPLGTIWIAAHLERKLRKNQVADTDIGVSVDSILFPEAPIALRLSSHLLLGVVRIYSRKVNYLFDDCSEALLKIKQAFRSTAVDLPPEQSKAPYHSITLPETFDLDDFELPDNDIFQGNFVDHHVSSREQITLQDTMDGVAYSTTLFGLDERFGDGDISGLDLDEELFFDKVGTSGDAGVSTDAQACVQTMTADLKQGDHLEEMAANSEPMIDGVDEDVDLVDDAQAPRTPGLIEEPNLSNAQETSTCDDHFEAEDHHLTEYSGKENLENISGDTDIHHGNKPVDGWSLPDTNSHLVVGMPSENGYPSGDLDIKQLKPQDGSAEQKSPDNYAFAPGSSSLLDNHVTKSSPVSESANKIVESSDILYVQESMHGVLEDTDKTNIGSLIESFEDFGRPNESDPRKSNDVSGSPRACQQESGGLSVNIHTSPRIELPDCLENASSLETRIELPDSVENASSLEKSVEIDYKEKAEGQSGKESKFLSLDINGKITDAQGHILRTCNANRDQPDSSNPEGDQLIDPNISNENANFLIVDVSGWEETLSAAEQGDACHLIDGSEKVSNESNVKETPSAEGVHEAIEDGCNLIDGSEKVTNEDNMRDPSSDEGIHVAIGKSNEEVDNGTLGARAVENVSSSVTEDADLPAPERLRSVTEGPDDLPKRLLMESTPGEYVSNNYGDVGSNIISGKKRSHTESTLTEQSLNSVESFRMVRSKRTVESVPDDDDLLSSILVGHKSSALKVKLTPSPWETTSVKRNRSAPRTSALKRKVLMDDSMVLHGDAIRKQLINTEDIRRVRKKAPCTRPEISMIQKQFFEEEIFMEAIYTGVSMELASLHNQAYDLSGISVSLDNEISAPLQTATDTRSSPKDDNDRIISAENAEGHLQSDTKESEIEENGEHLMVAENIERETFEAPLDEVKLDEDCNASIEVNIMPLQSQPTTDLEPSSSFFEPPEHVAETEIDKSGSGSDGVNSTVHEHVAETEIEKSGSGSDGVNSTVPATDENHAPGDRGDTSADVAIDGSSGGGVQAADNDITCEAVASLHIDATGMSHDDQRREEIYPQLDAGEVVECSELLQKNFDLITAMEVEPQTGNEALLEAAEGDATTEIATDANNGETDYELHKLVNRGVEQSSMHSNNGETEYELHKLVNRGVEQSSMHSFTGEIDIHVKDVLLGDGECPSQEFGNPLNMTDADISSVFEHDDFNYSTAGNATEFLNVDDDEVVEPSDDYIPNEEAPVADNSGWSSRTRAVANYLQTMFVKQSENARPTLAMDNLLVGKTRKEASRMFFEALVLKTKDYIHVEQVNPFENISIKPHMKLMKSDF